MLYIIGIILIFLSFKYIDNKYLSYLLLLYIWFIFAFNYYNPDYETYRYIYIKLGMGMFNTVSVTEKGFQILCYSLYNLGLTYEQFRIFLAFSCTFLLGITIKKYTKNCNIVYSLFIVFPLWISIVQIRSFISLLIVLLAIYYLSENKKIIFIFLILFATCFHSSSILYLILLLSPKFSIQTCIIYSLFIFLLCFFIQTDLVRLIISRFVSTYKMDNWLDGNIDRTMLGIIILIIVKLLLIVIEFIFYIKEKYSSKINLYQHKFILKISILCFSLTSLEIFKSDFERMWRVPIVLSYIFFADLISTKKIVSNINVRKITVFLLYYSGYLIYFFIGFSTYFDIAFRPIFENNLFF